MQLNRRSFLQLSLSTLAAGKAVGQGVSPHKTRAQARLAPSGQPFHARFTDVAKEAGLVMPVVYGDAQHKDYILETVGCGCAFFDYDNDGWMDVFLLSGSVLSGPPAWASNRLYKNNRDGTFTDVTEKAGLHFCGWGSGVCIGDYNNDGWEDLFCTFYGQNKLYRNNGDGTFTDVTKPAGLESAKTRWGAGCTFLDYDRDGRLDLFVSNYVQFDQALTPKPGENVYCNWKGVPVNCGPRGLPPGYHSLYRNNGDGTFSDVSVQAGVDGLRGSYGMTVVAADFDEDGWPDIFVACDSTPSFLLMNQRNGTFREDGLIRGVALDDNGLEQAGMGVGVGDYDLDGHLDLFKTHFTEDTAGLFHNNGKGVFENTTMAARVGTENRYICWGAGIVDLDNDGFPDLFLTAGSVYPEVEKALPQFPAKNPRVVFRNLGNGTFEELIEEAGPGVAAAHCSRGCAFGDFDNDGDLDVLIVNLSEPPSLLRNDVSGNNHWLKVKLVGTKSNRSAIGTRVLARYGRRMQAQEVLSQSSFYSANDPRLHFGLGAENSANLEIRWPSGLRETLKGVHANQIIVVKEGTAAAVKQKSAKGQGIRLR
jgi:enediyne biosynthesis protein E4